MKKIATLFLFTVSVSGQSLLFDGTDDYVQVPDHSSLDITNELTIASWVNPDSYDGTILAKRDFSGGERTNYHTWVDASGYIGFEFNHNNSATGNATSVATIPTNSWSHVAITYDQQNIKIYINGELNKTVQETDDLTPNNNVLSIGRVIRQSNSNFSEFDGKLDEVAIWNEAITAAEITALYNSGSGLSAASNSGDYTSSTNLQGYWKMNEGSGTSVADASSNSNTGTISGASWSNDSFGSTKVDYASGTGTTTLTFNYTVASGHTSNDLDYSSASALTLNSGTIKDAAGNAATLTLASPGATNSLGANKAIVIDGIAPTVSSVSSPTADGTYKIGDVIAVTTTFSEAVTVTGTPQLELDTGSGSSAGSSLLFDGTDEYVNLGADSVFDLDSFTISGWIKGTKSNGYIFQAEASYGYHLLLENGKPSLVLWYNNTGNGCTSSTSVNDGSWHLISATYSGSEVKLYIDGSLDKTCSSVGTKVSKDGSSPITIGSGDITDGSSYDFEGAR